MLTHLDSNYRCSSEIQAMTSKHLKLQVFPSAQECKWKLALGNL